MGVSGLVKHHPHGSLLVDQLLVIIQPGLVAAGVAEGDFEVISGYTTGKELVSRAANW